MTNTEKIELFKIENKDNKDKNFYVSYGNFTNIEHIGNDETFDEWVYDLIIPDVVAVNDSDYDEEIAEKKAEYVKYTYNEIIEQLSKETKGK